MDHILRNVEAVIAAADACSGMAVDYRRCRAYVTNAGPAIAKPGGLYVLTDVPDGPVRVRMEGEGYQPIELTLSPGGQFLYHAYLLPDRKAVLPRSTTVLCGRCSAKKLTAITQRKGKAGKLAADCMEGDRYVTLFPSPEIMEGRTLQLSMADGGDRIEERITLKEETEDKKGRFALMNGLAHTYVRTKCTLCNVFDVPLAEDGTYFYPFSGFPEKNGICRLIMDGRQVSLHDIRAGEENRYDC